ncbi:hypothetical protein [Saliterribacillus persicus]|uniref:Uncharacterized protein n=1 Tax=Saliterribacillus persicus TaxID=930114 RepID=A0A368X5J1_9BACI|nr:hypothetical protein [Saliterribacillus persicus]RCW62969.1 hypothetical protein DFR57_1216 [Saliterribacillus persicus]
MIHTFEFYLRIDTKALQNLFSLHMVTRINWDNVRAEIKKINQKIDINFYGIKINYLKELVNEEYQINIKVDITKLLSKGKILEMDYYIVKECIQEFLNHSFGNHVIFDQHILTRIDYKLDAIVNVEKDRELLFHLIEKHTKKYSHKSKYRWGKTDIGEPYKYEASQYHNNKSVGLIIYDKQKERLEKNEPLLPFHKNVVRYELRLQNQHLNAKKRHDKLGKYVPKKLSAYFREEMWYEYMNKHVYPIVHKGDYYKITEAEKIIDSSSFTKRKKDKLRQFLVQVSKGSIDTPKQNLSKMTYRHYICDLDSLNINPILIPKNRKDFPCHLKNPFAL